MNVQAHDHESRAAAVTAHSIAELLECPPETSHLLNMAAECLTMKPGEVVFHQGDACRGLYVVISGEHVRKADRLNTRFTLGTTRAGELVELASALSGATHTYTLTAVTEGTLLLLPIETLHTAFERHPPLRMRLLQELARDVSRAYLTCCMTRSVPARRRRSRSSKDSM